MIIKSTRYTTGASTKRVVDHLLRGDENDAVVILQGGERDLRDAWRDAQAHGKSSALRVWILAPAVETTREQAFEALAQIAEEFGFDKARATVVEHDKKRAVPTFDRHWHFAVGEVDPGTGRILSSSFDRPRHEYLARCLESRFNHPVTPGAHTRAVLARLRREGQSAMADVLDATLAEQDGTPRPRESFTTVEHQTAKRRGVDLAKVREVATSALATCQSLSGLIAALAAAGLKLSPGIKSGEWVIDCGDGIEKSLRRLTRMPKAVFASRMEELIDVDVDAIGRSHPGDGDLRGIGGDPEGTADTAGIRELARCEEPGRGVLHGSDDPASGSADRRDGRDPQQPEGPSRTDDLARVRERDAVGDPGRLIAAVSGCVQATFALVLRAEALAMPSLARVEAVLERHVEAERTAVSRSPALPSHVDLDALAARERSASAATNAVASEIDVLNNRIGDLLHDLRRRKGSWRRWFPDRRTEDEIEALRERRDAIKLRYDTVQRSHGRAIADEAAARRAHVQAVASRQSEHAAAARASRTRLAVIERARTLLRHWPALAYVGARRLLAMASRVEVARDKGWDAGADLAQP